MLCSINDFYLCDETLSGGWALKRLQLRMQRIFDVVNPLPFLLYPDDEFLNPGQLYTITFYAVGDDFSNVGGQNKQDALFIATGIMPNVWGNSVIGLVRGPTLLDRNKRRVDISFSVERVHDSIKDAEEYIADHDATIPRGGDIKLITMGTETVIALVVNGALLSHELVRQIGKFTEHSYRIAGSTQFAPTPGTDHIITEDGDTITTEGGDKLIVEG